MFVLFPRSLTGRQKSKAPLAVFFFVGARLFTPNKRPKVCQDATLLVQKPREASGPENGAVPAVVERL